MASLRDRAFFIGASLAVFVVLLVVLHQLVSMLAGGLGGTGRPACERSQAMHALPAGSAGSSDADTAGGEAGGSSEAWGCDAASRSSAAYSMDAHDVHRAIEHGNTDMVRRIMCTPFLQDIVFGSEWLLEVIAGSAGLMRECVTDDVMVGIMRSESAARGALRNPVFRSRVSRWAVDYLAALKNMGDAEAGSAVFWHAVGEQDLQRLLDECPLPQLADLAECAGASDVFVGDGFPSMLRSAHGRTLLERAAAGGCSKLGAAVGRSLDTCGGDTLAELVALLHGHDAIAVQFLSGNATETREYSVRSAVFRVSEHTKTCMRAYVRERLVQGKKDCMPRLALECAPGVFDMVVGMADNRPQDISSALRLSCFLDIPGAGEAAALYGHLASAAKCSRSFCEKTKTSAGSAQRACKYMLKLLREYTSAYGVLVGVGEDGAVLYPAREDKYNKCASKNKARAVDKMCILDAAMDSIRQGDSNACGMLAWFMRGMDVRVLDVRWCGLDADMLKHIGRVKSLTALTMFGCGAPPCSIGYLGGLGSLKDLDLSRNSLCDRDMRDVGEMQSLVSLKARSCSLAPGSLVHLQGLRHLETLDVSNIVVRELLNSVNGNDMSAVAKMRNLKALYMRSCKRESGCLWHLRTLEGLGSLDISWTQLEEHDMMGIKSLKSLRILDIRSCKFESRDFRHIGDMKDLRVLDVSWNRLRAEDMRTIGRASGLEKLVMNRCDIDPGSLEHILGLERLSELWMVDSSVSDIARLNRRDAEAMRTLRSRGCVRA